MKQQTYNGLIMRYIQAMCLIGFMFIMSSPDVSAQNISLTQRPAQKDIALKKIPKNLKNAPTGLKNMPKAMSRRKAPISDIDILCGPAVIYSYSSEEGIETGGKTIEITKVNNTTLEIEYFTWHSTNKIRVNVNLSDGSFSIPSRQLLWFDEDGGHYLCAIINNQYVEPDTPVTGDITENGILRMTTGWADLCEGEDGNYYYSDGVWRESFLIPANGVMETKSNDGIKEAYNVYLEPGDEANTWEVFNFGGYGQVIEIKTYNDGHAVIPSQVVLDVAPGEDSDGEPYDDFYTYAADLNGGFYLGADSIVGTVTTKEISFGNWAMLHDISNGFKRGFLFKDGKITLTDEEDWSLEPKPIEYSLNGINYLLEPLTKTATIITVDALYNDVVVPERLAYEGQTYTVNAIADQAFTSSFNYSITLPSTITTVAAKAFDNMQASAIIWNSDTPLPPNAFANINNAFTNLLLYVNKSDIAPSGFANTIVNGIAQDIELIEGYVFHCPREFTARSISFTHEFTMQTIIGEKQGWETIALPFEVQSITHATKGHLIPFESYSPSSENKPFWLYKWSKEGFVKSSSMQANTPYLISMPNNVVYFPEYNLAGSVTFSATNAVVKATITPWSEAYNNKRFFAAYYFIAPATPPYVVASINSVNNLHTNRGGYAPGSIFISNSILRDTFPFEGYIYDTSANASSRSVIEIEFADENETLGIETFLTSPKLKNMYGRGVYSISGQRISADSSMTEAEATMQCLPAGIYIVNGKKVIVK